MFRRASAHTHWSAIFFDLDAEPETYRVPLLHPLAGRAWLAAGAGRNPAAAAAEASRQADGDEYFDIVAIDSAWLPLLNMVVSYRRITFDLRLPEPANASAARHKIDWDAGLRPMGQHVGVFARQVMYLVLNIAMLVRARYPGQRQPEFELEYDRAEGASTKAMDLLRNQLDLIAMTDFGEWSKSPAKCPVQHEARA